MADGEGHMGFLIRVLMNALAIYLWRPSYRGLHSVALWLPWDQVSF